MIRFLSILLSSFLMFNTPMTIQSSSGFEFSSSKKYVSLVRKLVPTTVAITVTFMQTIEVQEATSTDTTSVGLPNHKIKLIEIPKTVFGSGVYVSKYGHILSCAHLFGHGRILSIGIKQSDGTEMAGELLFVDHPKDLSLMRVYAENVKYARLAKLPPELGEEMIAIGQPLLLEWTVTTGIVSGLNRMIRENQNCFQIDAVINPGNSGGPSFNLDGELIGINVMTIGAISIPNWSGQGFAVSTEELHRFLERFKGL